MTTVQGVFYVHLQVSDLVRSRAFYAQALGWTLHTDETDVAGLWFGAGYVVLTAERRAPEERVYGGGAAVAVKAGDLDAEHARLSAGAAGPSPIETKPWGERSFTIQDPDGYRWVFCQATG